MLDASLSPHRFIYIESVETSQEIAHFSDKVLQGPQNSFTLLLLFMGDAYLFPPSPHN